MSGRYFLDTNVFVYSFDKSSPKKRDRARDLIAEALDTQRGVLSFQVIQEFMNVATRKFETPLSSTDCRTYLDHVLQPLCAVWSTVPLYGRALELMERWRYGFYDSLILAAALEAGCSILYTEDRQHGQAVEGMKIQSPFAR